MNRIDYAGSVHDQEEIDAVVSVMNGGPTAMRIGKHVKEMERLVAAAFAKKRGVMVNSGSSALYLAVELLRPQPGDEIVTASVTFSTDIAPMVRAGVTPVYVDVVADTYQIDTEQIEAAIGPRTRAILAPNLIGNCPDWDVIRDIADRHGLVVIEDSCDCLGATLRGTPTGTRADMSLTSFALSHIITAAGRRVRSGSSARSTGWSTTTCSSSTSAAGTSNPRSCRLRSAACRCASCPTTWPGASATLSCSASGSAAIPRCSPCRG
jgi:CDP-6-deoxy-D-xylo-4-hexulose-3-dehydrase